MYSAEILAIGTEILLGQIVDTNSQFFSMELARLGINCFYHTTVGDNKQRIVEALRTAACRSQLILTSGGLGPTPDDLTMECIACAFGSSLVRDDQIIAQLREFFKNRGYSMPESNIKQAYRPEGASVLPNPVGSAPGIIWELNLSELVAKGILPDDAISGGSGYCTVITFPGVPYELRKMWQETVRDYLMKRTGGETIYSCDLKHIGIGESSLAEKYAELLNLENPTVAPYAGRGECRLRVTAKANTEDAARKLAMPVIEKIKAESGVLCYGFDDQTLEGCVGNLLLKHNLTVSLAESCTGGLVSKRLTDVPGSSGYIELNLVTYSNEAKVKELSVPEDVLKEDGAVSEACARFMASGVRKHACADIGVSITGIAGPDGGTKEKPVGLVYLGIDSEKGGRTRELRLGDKAGRSEIRYRTSNECLNMIRLYILENYEN